MKKNLFPLLLLAGLYAGAQTKAPRLAPLNIGDKVPDITIPKLIDGKTISARLSDFNDRLLILDFWSTNCHGCIEGMPKMEALQAKFGDKIRILPVTDEHEALIRSFVKTNETLKPLRMSTVVEDKRLAQLFRYKVLSHEAWIYKGKLVALTQADYVDSAGISFILSGKKNNWPVKDDFVADADTAKTFLQINPAQLPDKNIPLRYAAVFGYRPGGYSIRGVAYDRLRHTRRVYFTNDIILSAYFHYWHELRDPDFKKGLAYTPDSNRIIMEVKSRYPYAFPDELHEHNDEYHRTHMICYESVAPDDGASRGALARAVIADLDHLLGLHGRFETRKTKCLVLVRTSTEDKLKAPANVTQTTGRESVGAWHNRSLKDLAETINKRSMPVLDETGYTGNVYMDLNISSWTDIPALRKALHAYDLDLKEEERDLELFILTETKQ